MSERQSMMGQQVEIRRKRQTQAASCAALKEQLRALVPTLAEPQELDRDAILDTAAALHGDLAELEILDRKLSILNRELGE